MNTDISIGILDSKVTVSNNLLKTEMKGNNAGLCMDRRRGYFKSTEANTKGRSKLKQYLIFLSMCFSRTVVYGQAKRTVL